MISTQPLTRIKGLYFISDEAYEYLYDMAVANDYARHGAGRKAWISTFINDLSLAKFKDNRPQDVRDTDDARIQSFHVPFWNLEHVRKGRELTLKQDAVTRYCLIAAQHKIHIGRAYKGGPLWNSPIAITSAVLEAIGIDWLIPDYS